MYVRCTVDMYWSMFVISLGTSHLVNVQHVQYVRAMFNFSIFHETWTHFNEVANYFIGLACVLFYASECDRAFTVKLHGEHWLKIVHCDTCFICWLSHKSHILLCKTIILLITSIRPFFYHTIWVNINFFYYLVFSKIRHCWNHLLFHLSFL